MAHLRDLQARAPSRGYFPEPRRSILVMAPWNVARAEEFFRGMVQKMVKGSRYLGRFIREIEAEKSYMARKVT